MNELAIRLNFKITNLLEVLISRTTKDSLDSSFLIRCASSMTMYFQLNFLKTLFSRRSISYEVTTTSHPPGIMVSRMNLLRVSWSPMRHTALLMKMGRQLTLWIYSTNLLSVLNESQGRFCAYLKVGHHCLNSFIQLASVDLGTNTMWGPFTFRKCFM